MSAEDQPMVKRSRSALEIKLRCGSCRHHTTTPPPGDPKTCIQLGVIPEARPCEKFKPAAKALRFDSSEKVSTFRECVSGMSPNQLKVVAAFLNQETQTRNAGFAFGEMVYLRILGGDYLQNYRRAVVVAADSDYVYVSGRFERFSAALKHSSVMKEDQWRSHRRKLLRTNSITDPNHFKLWHAQPAKEVSNYQPPNIDDELSQFTEESAKTKTKNKIRPVDEILREAVTQPLIAKKASHGG